MFKNFVHHSTYLKIYGKIILTVSIKFSKYNNIFFLKKITLSQQSSLSRQEF